MHLVDLFERRLQAAFIDDHIIGHVQALLAARLACENTAGTALTLAVTGHQAPNLDGFVAIHNEDAVHLVSHRRGSQQGYDEHLVGALRSGGKLERALANSGVEDVLEALTGVIIRKYDPAHNRPIQCSFLSQHGIAKLPRDCGQRRGTGFDNLAGDNIRIDDIGTQFREKN